jgi:hypothetical protein
MNFLFVTVISTILSKPLTESCVKKKCEKSDIEDRRRMEATEDRVRLKENIRQWTITIEEEKTTRSVSDQDHSKVTAQVGREAVQEIGPCEEDRKAARTVQGESVEDLQIWNHLNFKNFRYRRKENVGNKDRRDERSGGHHRSPVR